MQLVAVPASNVHMYIGGRYRKTRGSVITLISNIYTSFTTGPWPPVTRGPPAQLSGLVTHCVHVLQTISEHVQGCLTTIARIDRSRASGVAECSIDPKMHPLDRSNGDLNYPPRENARLRKVEVVLTVFSVPILGHRFTIVVAPPLHFVINRLLKIT